MAIAYALSLEVSAFIYNIYIDWLMTNWLIICSNPIGLSLKTKINPNKLDEVEKQAKNSGPLTEN